MKRSYQQRLSSLSCLALMGSLLLPVVAAAQEGAATGKKKKGFDPEGRISLRGFFQTDNEEVPTAPAAELGQDPPTAPLGIKPVLTSLDIDVAMRELQGSNLSLLVDAEFRKDLTDQFSSPPALIPREHRLGLDFGDRRDRSLGLLRSETYVKSAYAEYTKLADLLRVRLGRMLLYDYGQTWVDGVHLSAPMKSGLELGVFGGLNPDPLDYSVDPDYKGGGAHLGFTGERGLAALAINMSTYKGKADRAFLFSRAHWQLIDGLFASYFLTVDMFRLSTLDEQGSTKRETKPHITQGFANVAWQATEQVSFRLSLATYQNVVLAAPRDPPQSFVPTQFNQEAEGLGELERENMLKARDTYFRYLGAQILQAPYYRAKLTSGYKFLDHYYAYNEIDWLQRSLDKEEATFLAFGLRDSDLLGSRTFMHLRLRFRDNFLSDSTEALLQFRRQFGGIITAGISGSRLSGRSLALQIPLDVLRNTDPAEANPRREALAEAERLQNRLEQRQDVYILAADVDVDVTDRLWLSLTYEFTHESATQADEGVLGKPEDLTIHALNVRLTYRL